MSDFQIEMSDFQIEMSDFLIEMSEIEMSDCWCFCVIVKTQ